MHIVDTFFSGLQTQINQQVSNLMVYAFCTLLMHAWPWSASQVPIAFL